jgi:Restriction endonuclease
MKAVEEIASWLEVAQRVSNATTSVRVFAPLSSEWILPVEREFFLYATSGTVRREYMVTSPERPREQELSFLRTLHSFGWEVMWVKAPKSLVGILVDSSVAYIGASKDRAFAIRELGIVEGLGHHFDRTWQVGKVSVGTEILFDDILVTSGPQPIARVQVEAQPQWDRTLHGLARNLADVRQLPPRAFEELVAELLQRDRPTGVVKLTPASKDGGRDVMVFEDTPLGRHLFLVECKRYGPENPVDVALIRQLYGVIEGENASAGALVTSSFFTAPARLWPVERNLSYRISLRDYDDLGAWIRRHAPLAV